MAKPIEPLASRMERLVDRSGDCWPWMGSCDAYGYGQLGIGASAKRKAHRVAWEVAYGEIPAGLQVLHRCDNPPCCNPAHLFLGTPADNMRDAASKGRQFVPTPPRLTGERNPSAKLTDNQRWEIRRLAAALTQDQLATRFGVSQSTISRVIGRRMLTQDINRATP